MQFLLTLIFIFFSEKPLLFSQTNLSLFHVRPQNNNTQQESLVFVISHLALQLLPTEPRVYQESLLTG